MYLEIELHAHRKAAGRNMKNNDRKDPVTFYCTSAEDNEVKTASDVDHKLKFLPCVAQHIYIFQFTE